MSEKGVTPLSEDFSAWYNEVIIRAELVEHGPVRGTMVIRPYGYHIWETIQNDLNTRITAAGHSNVAFPSLIPQSYLHREAEHIEGFSPELAIVTHAGGKDLDEPLAIRPTSETIFGEYMARWINSHRDLPLLLNQWANVVRWELRPRLFLRTTEFLWQEGHTAHANETDAMHETLWALDTYATLARDTAAIPVITGEKTPGERFAGAQRTYTVEAMMRDGRALQAGTAHYLGTNFARAFNIHYQDHTGHRQLTHTTSWGMSTRMIGGIIMTHGDDHGLVLPPKIAPHHIVIIPIGRDSATTTTAHHLATQLRDAHLRVHVDDRTNLSPGFKFHHWELRGVPLRLELGPRDLDNHTVTLVPRLPTDTIGKQQLPISNTPHLLPGILEDFQQFLLHRAETFRDQHTTTVHDWHEFTEQVTHGWAQAHHCGRTECENDIKTDTAATPRCIPTHAPHETGPCIRCGLPSAYDRRIIFGRAY